jgi:hypothetical protein
VKELKLDRKRKTIENTIIYIPTKNRSSYNKRRKQISLDLIEQTFCADGRFNLKPLA